MVGWGKISDKHGDVDKTGLCSVGENYRSSKPVPHFGGYVLPHSNNGEYYARGSDYSNLKSACPTIDLVYWIILATKAK